MPAGVIYDFDIFRFLPLAEGYSLSVERGSENRTYPQISLYSKLLKVRRLDHSDIVDDVRVVQGVGVM
jgi:hypothetical protein